MLGGGGGDKSREQCAEGRKLGKRGDERTDTEAVSLRTIFRRLRWRHLVWLSDGLHAAVGAHRSAARHASRGPRPHDAPDKPEDLLEHEAIPHGTESWSFTDGDEGVGLDPRRRFEADNGIAVIAAVIEGPGIAVIPDGLTAEHPSTCAPVRWSG